jgi:diaminopropionate ammonia-lyase
MSGKIQWVVNPLRQSDGPRSLVELFNDQQVANVRRFHTSFPTYQPTPLRRLDTLAKMLGVAGVYVKDESYRFGLQAFKALGCSYAMARLLAARLGEDMEQMTFAQLTSPATKARLGDLTFVTATDGNHGRGVAWTARQLRQKAVVYMPRGTSASRLANIRAEGAEVSIIDGNYDDAVRLAAMNAEKFGWLVVQDTAWPVYTDIPNWIMQGYCTMAAEAREQLVDLGVGQPTHVFVQAGVGSLAAAVQGYFAAALGAARPQTVVVEADQAACLLQSAQAGDGQPRKVSGELATIMAGLACGEPNIIAWNILRDYTELFVVCPDWVTARGMRILGNPAGSDARIVAGESGAVSTGLLSVIMQDQALLPLRQAMHLGADSQVMLFSTEGDTDPQHYRRVVWDGEYPQFYS